MYSSFRNRFGIPGVISVIALVFAMFGGAYAANNSGGDATASKKAKKVAGLNAKQKREVTNLAKRFAGRPGAQGQQGPQGPVGAAGAQGAKGDAGANGANGTNGADGDTGATGPAGADGATGPEGSPWTAGGTLPPGETLTGAWAVTGPAFGGQQKNVIPISFPIPLAEELLGTAVHFNKAGDSVSSGCTGGTKDQPKADPGHLCVYGPGASTILDPVVPIFKAGTAGLGASKTGAYVLIQELAVATAFTEGTWAVTAPSP